MPLEIVYNNITTMTVDAIVNVTDSSLLKGGKLWNAIHTAAGESLLEKCKALGGCKIGYCKITSAYNLPCKYVIHTAEPCGNVEKHTKKLLIQSCYRQALVIAREHGCKVVAIPLIAPGCEFLESQAIKIAADIIDAFLVYNEMTVYLVLQQQNQQKKIDLYNDVTKYINQNYVPTVMSPKPVAVMDTAPREPLIECCISAPSQQYTGMPECAIVDLDDKLNHIEESFSQMLLRMIDQKGLTDAECYKKANIDRKLFSKIRSNVYYKPSKNTAIAFALALELSLDETRDMLCKAGFALSHSSKFDIIIEYFINKQIYNIFEINETLYNFNQDIL